VGTIAVQVRTVPLAEVEELGPVGRSPVGAPSWCPSESLVPQRE
jgi:hypothetical protein